MAARSPPGEQVGVALAGRDGEVAVRRLVDDAVDGGDAAADVDGVALADAGQPLGDPGGRGLLGGLGFLADGAALGGALGVEQPLGCSLAQTERL